MRTKGVFLVYVFLFLLAYLSPLRAQPPEVSLVVNQAGFDLAGVKRVWAQTSFFPESLSQFQIVCDHDIVYTGNWTQPVQVWDRWFMVGDFSALSTSGEYRARVQWEGENIESPPFIIEPDRLLKWTGPLAVRFFSIQRCGTEVPGWHAACHLDDARMPDNTIRDLTGGWHDAGDYNKYNGFTPLAVYALAKFAGNQAVQNLEWDADFPTPLEEALWGAIWLRKMQDPLTKKIASMVFSGFEYWGPPEFETDNIPGNWDDRPAILLGWDENEMTVAAYAVLYACTQDSVWKDAALELWHVVTSHESQDSVIQRAKRLLAAAEVYRITGDSQVLRDAEESAAYLLLTQEAGGGWPKWPTALVDFGMPVSALAEFVLAAPMSGMTGIVRDALHRHIQYWDQCRLRPFDIPKWNDNNHFFPMSHDEWYIGQNGMYLSQAWAGALLARVFPQDRARITAWTQGCLDWVTGANPFGICMMYGAGTHHLYRYHHRYEKILNGKNGKVPGAICNGISRESPDADLPYLDLTGNAWQTNEPWLPHNAFYLLTLNQLESNLKKAGQRR